MLVVDASGEFALLIEAIENLKCWLVDEKHVVWTKDAIPSIETEPVSRWVQARAVDEALELLERQHGNNHYTFITYNNSHADAALASGAQAVLVDPSDTCAGVAARVVSETVRARKAQHPGLTVVACVMKPSRQASLCKQKLVHLHPHQGVMFCPIDPVVTHVCPAFDALLVKLTDYLDERVDGTGNLSVEFQLPLRQLVKEALAAGKAVVDRLECVRKVLDRRETRKQLQHIQEATHGLMEVFPYLAENFHNHGGTVIKCYAVHEQLFLRAAPSLPDIVKSRQDSNCCHTNASRSAQPCNSSPASMADTLTSGGGEVAFHTLTNMPCVAPGSVNTALAQDPLTLEAAQGCAAVIRDAVGLSLFGFDLIVPSTGAGYMLVDVNAFPSFKGIEGAADALRLFLKRQCNL